MDGISSVSMRFRLAGEGTESLTEEQILQRLEMAVMADRSNEKKMMRLDRYLAEMGIGSRSSVKEMIRKKQVCVDGAAACGPEQKSLPGKKECITVSGRRVDFVSKEYFYAVQAGRRGFRRERCERQDGDRSDHGTQKV